MFGSDLIFQDAVPGSKCKTGVDWVIGGHSSKGTGDLVLDGLVVSLLLDAQLVLQFLIASRQFVDCLLDKLLLGFEFLNTLDIAFLISMVHLDLVLHLFHLYL